MKVLVFDRAMRVVGHRLPYAALVADSLSEEHDVILAIPDRLRDKSEATAYLKSHFRTDYFVTKDRKSGIGIAFETRRNLIRLIKKHNPDVIAIPTGDGLVQICGFLNIFGISSFSRKPIHICIMRGLQILPEKPVKQWLSRFTWWGLKKGPWKSLLLIDPREWNRLKPAEKKRIGLCPDPVPITLPVSKIDARHKLNLPLDGKLIVAAGEQSKRKGSDLLIQSFVSGNFDESTYLVLMGKLTDASKRLIEQHKTDEKDQSKIIVHDRFLSENEFQNAILASDIVAAPYRSVNRPSGIVLRCMRWQRLLVLNNKGWLRWINDHYDVGISGNAENAIEYGEALLKGLEASEKYKLSHQARAFVEFNSEEKFRQLWKNIILAGQIPSPPTFLSHSIKQQVTS